MATVNYYVDVTQSSTGGDGSLGNPWGMDEFTTDIQDQRLTEDTIYNLFGDGSAGVSTTMVFGNSTRNSIIIQAYGNTPPKMSLPASISLGHAGYPITLKRLLMDPGGADHVFSGSLNSSVTLTLENCILINNPLSGVIDFFASMQNCHINLNYCTFFNPLGSVLFFDEASSNKPIITMNSCYFDGPFAPYFNKVNVTYKDCGFYNNPSFTSIATNSTVTNNNGNLPVNSPSVNDPTIRASLTQVVNLRGLPELVLPGDIRPLTLSAIAGAGDPTIGVTVDANNFSRSATNPSMGAGEYKAVNYFNTTPLRNFVPVLSTIDQSYLETLIGSDPYFDSTNKITRVDVFYTQAEGRQQKHLIHVSPTFQTAIYWSAFAKDGTWEKTRVKTYNHDGAINNLYRADIGTSEDIVLT